MDRLSKPTAPYRFVPIDPNMVVSPPVPRSEISMTAPLTQGSVSARIKVTYTAKTPICVGQVGSDDVVVPASIGGRYCLPGTSLRGMIRSVAETATFSHLGRINAHHHHGFRDFEGLKSSEHHAISANDIRGGWIRFDGANWLFYPCSQRTTGQLNRIDHHDFILVTIDSLIQKLDDVAGSEDWLRGLSAAQKYQLLADAGLLGKHTNFLAQFALGMH